MAAKAKPKKTAKKKPGADKDQRRGPVRAVLRRLRQAVVLGVAVLCLWIILYGLIRPPTTPYIVSEGIRLGGVERQWVPLEEVAPIMQRAVVAAEDANFCLHWGIDMGALRLAIAEGGQRGASTISQQTVKNAFLWHGRSWTRKALEAVMTPLMELFWTKRRVLEVYLNVIEFDEGVFGVEAAALHHFGVPAHDLSERQASLLAAVLPDPKGRSAVKPSGFVQRRAAAIRAGAETIRADGRASCFED